MGPLWGAKVPGIAVRNAAFWHDLGLKTVAIPASVTIIKPFAFDRCERLESEKLSSSLKSILSSTFGSSARLLEIKIPLSLLYRPAGLQGLRYPFDPLLCQRQA